MIPVVASEAIGYHRTGGLGDVVSALAPELLELGYDVRVILPATAELLAQFHAQRRLLPTLVSPYLDLEKSTFFKDNIEMPEAWLNPSFRPHIFKTKLGSTSVPLYLLQPGKISFRGEKNHYTQDDARHFYTRYGSLAAWLIKNHMAYDRHKNPRPIVVHANDWQAGVVPTRLSTMYTADQIASVFTVHNDRFDARTRIEDFEDETSLWGHQHPGLYEHFGNGILHRDRVSLLKAGINRSDMATVVSPGEALRLAQGGSEFSGVIRRRLEQGRWRGVLNGIGQEFFPQAITPETIRQTKGQCKLALQRKYNLTQDPNAVFMSMASRLSDAKGYGHVLTALQEIVHTPGRRIQLLITSNAIGSEGQRIEQEIRRVAGSLYGTRIEIKLVPFDTNNPQAEVDMMVGSDIVLMPSEYEPCGLVQMKGQANGALPIGHNTGGLSDTIEDGIDGFKYGHWNPDAFKDCLLRALRAFDHSDAWYGMAMHAVIKAQTQYTWRHRTLEWVEVYREAIAIATGPSRYL